MKSANQPTSGFIDEHRHEWADHTTPSRREEIS